MENKIWIILVLLMFFVTIHSALSAPPTSQLFDGIDGIGISSPSLEYYKLGEGANLILKLNNKSNGVPITQYTHDVSCQVNVVGTNGSLFFSQECLPENDYYSFYYNDTMLPEEGIYSYILVVNTSDAGGYKVGYFDITQTGYSQESNPIVAIFLVCCLFGLTMMCIGVYLLTKIKGENEYNR